MLRVPLVHRQIKHALARRIAARRDDAEAEQGVNERKAGQFCPQRDLIRLSGQPDEEREDEVEERGGEEH